LRLLTETCSFQENMGAGTKLWRVRSTPFPSVAAGPLVPVNTRGLAEGGFKSELFGHGKGAFTDARTDRIGRFELADGGTIFLDEIGNVPFRQQAKLLRVIESGEMERVGSSRSKKIDVRVIPATNTDLKAACDEGQFREDLLLSS
jgi:transcriptional regulator with GAF, ATPase, and Fis domain